jgi:hypothetical protein
MARANVCRGYQEGAGRIQYPVTAARAKKLTTLSAPARFGRGERTLTDPQVRDTSMLVYETGQFFVTHRDSEKDDSMIGTLVVTLPTSPGGPGAPTRSC